MANNKQALKELIKIANKHIDGRISTEDYLKESESIIYNQVSARNANYFNSYIDLITIVRRAAKHDPDAWQRLLIDLEIKKVNLTIKPL